jgi:hypothetical protein
MGESESLPETADTVAIDLADVTDDGPAVEPHVTGLDGEPGTALVAPVPTTEPTVVIDPPPITPATIGLFYDMLNEETRAAVLQHRDVIRGCLKRTAEDIVVIGRSLSAIKTRLGHGRFGEWIAAEFGMSAAAAHRFMQVARVFGDQIAQFERFEPSALYLLAAQTTPESVREQFIHLAETGQVVRHKDVRAVLDGTDREPAKGDPQVREPVGTDGRARSATRGPKGTAAPRDRNRAHSRPTAQARSARPDEPSPLAALEDLIDRTNDCLFAAELSLDDLGVMLAKGVRQHRPPSDWPSIADAMETLSEQLKQAALSMRTCAHEKEPIAA